MSTTKDNAQIQEVMIDALREAGLQADRDTASRLLDYLDQRETHLLHASTKGDVTTGDISSWQPFIENAVQRYSPQGSKADSMVRFAASTRDGGFAYVCLPSNDEGRKIFAQIEQLGTR